MRLAGLGFMARNHIQVRQALMTIVAERKGWAGLRHTQIVQLYWLSFLAVESGSLDGIDLDAHRERLRARLIRIRRTSAAPTLEAALQQAHQAGVPVADHEQNQEWRGEVVVV